MTQRHLDESDSRSLYYESDPGPMVGQSMMHLLECPPPPMSMPMSAGMMQPMYPPGVPRHLQSTAHSAQISHHPPPPPQPPSHIDYQLMNGKREQCAYCQRTFTCKRELYMHQYTHKERVGSLPCNYCDKMFSNEQAQKRHIAMHQREESRYVWCDVCQKAFRTVRDLDRHHTREHAGYKAYQCLTCGIEFSWKDNLIRHEQIHKDRPHVCLVCKRSFPSIKMLQKHKNLHQKHHLPRENHDKSQIHRPTQGSDIVAQSADQEEWLNEHMYKCTLCSQTFQYSFSLEAHMKAHQDINQLPVSAASSDASTSSSKSSLLKQHVCRICNKSFQYVLSLKAHYKDHEVGSCSSPKKKTQPRRSRPKPKPMHKPNTVVTVYKKKDNTIVPISTRIINPSNDAASKPEKSCHSTTTSTQPYSEVVNNGVVCEKSMCENVKSNASHITVDNVPSTSATDHTSCVAENSDVSGISEFDSTFNSAQNSSIPSVSTDQLPVDTGSSEVAQVVPAPRTSLPDSVHKNVDGLDTGSVISQALRVYDGIEDSTAAPTLNSKHTQPGTHGEKQMTDSNSSAVQDVALLNCSCTSKTEKGIQPINQNITQSQIPTCISNSSVTSAVSNHQPLNTVVVQKNNFVSSTELSSSDMREKEVKLLKRQIRSKTRCFPSRLCNATSMELTKENTGGLVDVDAMVKSSNSVTETRSIPPCETAHLHLSSIPGNGDGVENTANESVEFTPHVASSNLLHVEEREAVITSNESISSVDENCTVISHTAPKCNEHIYVSHSVASPLHKSNNACTDAMSLSTDMDVASTQADQVSQLNVHIANNSTVEMIKDSSVDCMNTLDRTEIRDMCPSKDELFSKICSNSNAIADSAEENVENSQRCEAEKLQTKEDEGDSHRCEAEKLQTKEDEGDSHRCEAEKLQTKENGDSQRCEAEKLHTMENEGNSQRCEAQKLQTKENEGDSQRCEAEKLHTMENEGNSHRCEVEKPKTKENEGNSHGCEVEKLQAKGKVTEIQDNASKRGKKHKKKKKKKCKIKDQNSKDFKKKKKCYSLKRNSKVQNPQGGQLTKSDAHKCVSVSIVPMNADTELKKDSQVFSNNSGSNQMHSSINEQSFVDNVEKNSKTKVTCKKVKSKKTKKRTHRSSRSEKTFKISKTNQAIVKGPLSAESCDTKNASKNESKEIASVIDQKTLFKSKYDDNNLQIESMTRNTTVQLVISNENTQHDCELDSDGVIKLAACNAQENDEISTDKHSQQEMQEELCQGAAVELNSFASELHNSNAKIENGTACASTGSKANIPKALHTKVTSTELATSTSAAIELATSVARRSKRHRTRGSSVNDSQSQDTCSTKDTKVSEVSSKSVKYHPKTSKGGSYISTCMQTNNNSATENTANKKSRISLRKSARKHKKQIISKSDVRTHIGTCSEAAHLPLQQVASTKNTDESPSALENKYDREDDDSQKVHNIDQNVEASQKTYSNNENEDLQNLQNHDQKGKSSQKLHTKRKKSDELQEPFSTTLAHLQSAKRTKKSTDSIENDKCVLQLEKSKHRKRDQYCDTSAQNDIHHVKCVPNTGAEVTNYPNPTHMSVETINKSLQVMVQKHIEAFNIPKSVKSTAALLTIPEEVVSIGSNNANPVQAKEAVVKRKASKNMNNDKDIPLGNQHVTPAELQNSAVNDILSVTTLSTDSSQKNIPDLEQQGEPTDTVCLTEKDTSSGQQPKINPQDTRKRFRKAAQKVINISLTEKNVEHPTLDQDDYARKKSDHSSEDALLVCSEDHRKCKSTKALEYQDRNLRLRQGHNESHSNSDSKKSLCKTKNGQQSANNATATQHQHKSHGRKQILLKQPDDKETLVENDIPVLKESNPVVSSKEQTIADKPTIKMCSVGLEDVLVYATSVCKRKITNLVKQRLAFQHHSSNLIAANTIANEPVHDIILPPVNEATSNIDSDLKRKLCLVPDDIAGKCDRALRLQKDNSDNLSETPAHVTVTDSDALHDNTPENSSVNGNSNAYNKPKRTRKRPAKFDVEDIGNDRSRKKMYSERHEVDTERSVRIAEQTICETAGDVENITEVCGHRSKRKQNKPIKRQPLHQSDTNMLPYSEFVYRYTVFSYHTFLNYLNEQCPEEDLPDFVDEDSSSVEVSFCGNDTTPLKSNLKRKDLGETDCSNEKKQKKSVKWDNNQLEHIEVFDTSEKVLQHGNKKTAKQNKSMDTVNKDKLIGKSKANIKMQTRSKGLNKFTAAKNSSTRKQFTGQKPNKKVVKKTKTVHKLASPEKSINTQQSYQSKMNIQNPSSKQGPKTKHVGKQQAAEKTLKKKLPCESELVVPHNLLDSTDIAKQLITKSICGYAVQNSRSSEQNLSDCVTRRSNRPKQVNRLLSDYYNTEDLQLDSSVASDSDDATCRTNEAAAQV